MIDLPVAPRHDAPMEIVVVTTVPARDEAAAMLQERYPEIPYGVRKPGFAGGNNPASGRDCRRLPVANIAHGGRGRLSLCTTP